MVRPAQDQLTAVPDRLRSDARAVAAAAVAAVSPRVLVPAALTGVAADVLATPGPLAVVAAGKAAAAMHAAFADSVPGAVTASLAVGPHRPDGWAGGAWVTGGHPFATDGSVEAARRALEVARSVDPDGRLILLLSGGASALMAGAGARPHAGRQAADRAHADDLGRRYHRAERGAQAPLGGEGRPAGGGVPRAR